MVEQRAIKPCRKRNIDSQETILNRYDKANAEGPPWGERQALRTRTSINPEYHGKAPTRSQVPARLRHRYGLEERGFFNSVLSKSYKDGDEWKDTDQLGTGVLLNA